MWTIRKIIDKDNLNLKDAGILWFNDLSAADPYSILPLVN